MKCAVVKFDRWPNGQIKRMTSGEIRELSLIAAENLSETRTVIPMTKTFGGYVTVIEDRMARQVLLDLEELESAIWECEFRKNAEFRCGRS